jgi:putative hydrolase of HD superfamily
MDQEQLVGLAATVNDDLASRIDFMLEIDKLKGILRRSRIVDGSRFENTAEHSWHLAMAAMIFGPLAGPDVDLQRTIEILLVHDIVEIDAGDTYIYDADASAHENKEAAENAAAERIFNLLPQEAATHIAELWAEYEERSTPTARFAYAIDRLQPLLLNGGSGGVSWTENGIKHSQAAAVNSPIGLASPELWQLAEKILATAADDGLLVDDRP